MKRLMRDVAKVSLVFSRHIIEKNTSCLVPDYKYTRKAKISVYVFKEDF